MRSIRLNVVCASTLLFAGVAARADIVTFRDLTLDGIKSCNDMSPDGRYIVGTTFIDTPYIFDTVTNTLTELPSFEAAEAVAVSDNGQVVLATMVDEQNRLVAGMWHQGDDHWTSLGFLPNANPAGCPSHSDGYELNADGTVAVGLSWDGCSGRGFRWTQATGMVQLQNLANGNCRASVVSGNGNVIGGFAQGNFSRSPAVWTGSASGQLAEGADTLGEIHGINDAGTMLLAERNGKAVIYSYPGLAVTQIGGGSALPGWSGIPQDISGNGTVVGFDFLSGNRRAWIHPAGLGPCIDLASYINGNGGSVPAGTILEVCQAISMDGKVIIGHGFAGAWIVQIRPTLCVADINGDNAVGVSDLLSVISSWGPCPNCPAPPSVVLPAVCGADIAPAGASSIGDCSVNVADLLAVITSWGTCPAPVGGCCTGTSCQQLSAAACASAGGVYLGNGAPCGATACANNDHCSSAQNITNKINGAAVQGDNSTATPAIFAGPDAELPLNSPTCHWAGTPESAYGSVWYSFVAPANGSVTIRLCNTTPQPFVDSIMALYAGSCGSLTEIACDEDSCTNGDYPYLSRITATGLTPGQTYRVAVMNSGGWNGSIAGPFTLNITSP